MAAVLATFEVTAERRGAAVPDRRHDLQLGQAQVTCLGGTIAVSGGSEDIGDLERRSHRDQPLGPAPSISSVRCSSGLVTARIVLVATRA